MPPRNANPFITIPCPNGMDSTSDPAHLSPGRCRLLQNFTTDRPGFIEGNPLAVNVLGFDLSAIADGIGAWYSYPETNDIDYPCGSTPVPIDTTTSRLLVIADGQLYVSDETPDGDPPSIHSMTAVGTASFFVGQTCRMLQMGKDTIIVQEGGNQPQRFTYWDGTPYVFQLGMCAPVWPGSPPVVLSAGAVTSTRYYAATYVDEQGRESSLSDPVGPYALNGTTHGTATITDWTGSGAAGIQERIVNVYGTVTGDTANFYLVGQMGDVAGDGMIVATVVDTLTDALLQANTLASNPGENDVPNPASLVSIFGGHVVLNDSTQDGTIQISNLNSATQFAAIPFQVTDGVRMEINSDQGNPISALVPFGDTLGIWRQKNFFQLYGTNQTNFSIRQLNGFPCIAPDSCVLCGDKILFLSFDGVRALGAQALSGGYLYSVTDPALLSKAIQTTLRATTAANRKRAVAGFDEYNNEYVLNVGNACFVFNFFSNEWKTYLL